MAFTAPAIKALKAKTARYTAWEDGHTGLGVRVSPTGRKAFVSVYRFEGRTRRITYGAFPRMGLADARMKHAEAMKKLEDGIDPGTELVAKKKAVREAETVTDLAEEYLEKHARMKKRTAAADERVLRTDIIPVWGRRKATSITRRNVVDLLDKIVGRGSPVQANRTLALLSKMFGFAVERDILSVSPCLHVKPPAKEVPRAKVLSSAELVAFWDGLDAAKMSPLTRLALRLLLVTAQRRMEVVCAPWEEFDLDEAMWSIPGARTKNGVPHRVPLSALALELLAEVKKASGGSPWLFPSPRGGQAMRPDAVSHAFRNNLEAIGLENVTPHDLRRTAVSVMTSIGVSRLVTEKIINHKDRGVAGIYDQYGYDRPKAEALEAWANRLREITSGEEPSTNVVPLGVAGG
jgi:integrase